MPKDLHLSAIDAQSGVKKRDFDQNSLTYSGEVNYYHCAEFEHGFCSQNIHLYHETLFSKNCDTTGSGVVSKHCRLQMQPPGGAWWSHMQPVANATTRVHGTAWWLHMQP